MKPTDMEQVCALLAKLHIETPYRCIAPDWPTIINALQAATVMRAGLVLVAEHAGEITGVMMAVAQPLWWVDQQQGARVASDMVFYSRRYGDGRKMLRKMVEWAFASPRVVRIEMAVSSGQAGSRVMKRLYESEGFTLEGMMFVLNHPRYQSVLDEAESARAA